MRGGETGVTLGPVSGVVAVRSYLKLTALSCPRNSFILLPREEAVMSSMSLTPWGAPPQFPMGRRPFRTAPMSSDHRRCSIPRCKSKKGIRRSVDYHLRAPRRLCSKLGRRRWSTVDGGRAQGETELKAALERAEAALRRRRVLVTAELLEAECEKNTAFALA